MSRVSGASCAPALSSTASPSRTPRPLNEVGAPGDPQGAWILVILDDLWHCSDMDGGARCWSGCAAGPACRSSCFSVRSERSGKVLAPGKRGGRLTSSKPFGMAGVPRARSRRHAASRARPTGEPVVKIGPLAIDLAARLVTIDGSRVAGLRRKSYRLLQLLAQHAGNVVTHQFLLKESGAPPHLNGYALSDAYSCASCGRKIRGRSDPPAAHAV